MKPSSLLVLTVGLLAALYVAFGGMAWEGWTLGPSTPPLVVVLYEADNGEPPSYALGAINELRAAGRQARVIDDDPATGTNSVPAEVAPAIEPGRKIMGGTDGKEHALVLLNGQRVVKAIKLPDSKEAILEAAQ